MPCHDLTFARDNAKTFLLDCFLFPVHFCRTYLPLDQTAPGILDYAKHPMITIKQNHIQYCFCRFMQALRLAGAWVAKTKSESSREILDSYLNPAVEAARVGCGATAENENGDRYAVAGDADVDAWGQEQPLRLLCAAHFTLAEYLVGLHASVRGRVQSPEWRAVGRVAESRQREIAFCRTKVCNSVRI